MSDFDSLPMAETQVVMYQFTFLLMLFQLPMDKYLETELFNQGIRPAVNVGLSVSRWISCSN